MSVLPEGDILEFALQAYATFGENINYTNKKIYAFRTINVIILLLTAVFILEACIEEEDIMLVKTFESAITILHILVKYLSFMYGKIGLKAIIEARTKFLDPEATTNQQAAQFAKKLYSHIKSLNTMLLVIFTISQEFYWLKPIFNSGQKFMLNARVPYNFLPLEAMALFMQYYSIGIVTSTVMAHDALFLAICGHLFVQLHLLQCKMHEAAVGEWDDLRRCIEYHQFLSSIFNQMQQIYSWVVLMQYFTTLGTVCVQLYILSSRAVNIADGVELIIYMSMLYCEVGFYSIPIEEISAKFLDIGTVIYMSTWYEEDPVRQKQLLTIITYSQITKFLKGGGIIPQNMDTFASVFRKSFSLYLLLKNVLQE